MSPRKVCGYVWDERFKKIRRVEQSVLPPSGLSEYDKKRAILSLGSMTRWSVTVSAGLDGVAKTAKVCYNLVRKMFRRIL